MIILLLVAAVPWQVHSDFNANAGPWFTATKGEVWPMPKSRVVKEDYYHLRPAAFDIRVSLSLYFAIFSLSIHI